MRTTPAAIKAVRQLKSFSASAHLTPSTQQLLRRQITPMHRSMTSRCVSYIVSETKACVKLSPNHSQI